MDFSKRRPVWDIGIVLGLLILGVLSDAVNRSVSPSLDDSVPVIDVVLLALVIVPLFWRRSRPLTTLVVVTAAFLVMRVAIEVPEGTASTIAVFVALFASGAYSHHRFRDRVRFASVALSLGFLVVQLVRGSADQPEGTLLFQVFALLLNLAFYGAGWVMGDLVRRRHEDQEELARRAGQLERQRHELADRAVAEERLRIARELHDVVGHHVSVMGVQAGAARRTLGVDRGRTEQLLASIESSSRTAVAEMGRLVGFLRETGEDEPAPQPTMERLDELFDSMAGAGLDVDVHRVGKPRPLDAATELSVYRVLQESLTNALRHGTEPHATVEISYLADGLSVRVRNPAEDGNGRTGGRGLVGMRERAGLVEGTLETGRGADGQFEVRALFPYGSSS